MIPLVALVFFFYKKKRKGDDAFAKRDYSLVSCFVMFCLIAFSLGSRCRRPTLHRGRPKNLHVHPLGNEIIETPM
jgi:hypothetical protein